MKMKYKNKMNEIQFFRNHLPCLRILKMIRRNKWFNPPDYRILKVIPGVPNRFRIVKNGPICLNFKGLSLISVFSTHPIFWLWICTIWFMTIQSETNNIKMSVLLLFVHAWVETFCRVITPKEYQGEMFWKTKIITFWPFWSRIGNSFLNHEAFSMIKL